MLKGGDPNAKLGTVIVLKVYAGVRLFSDFKTGRNSIDCITKVQKIMLLRSKLFLLSLAPHSSSA